MRQLLNVMRMQAMLASGDHASVRLGKVDSYDAVNYSAKVRLQPEDVITGWLPVTSQWVGNGWGMFAPPSIGELVEVHFQEGSIDAGIVNLRFFNDIARPLPVPSGEFWLQHKSGAFFKLTNAGAATFSDAHGASVTLNGDGTITSSASQWNHTGNVTVTGNVVASGDISDHTTKSMAAMRSTYNAHTHTDPQGGSVGTPSAGM